MFTPKQYRAKATEYGELVKSSPGQTERREYQDLEKSFTVLAENEQWLADHHHHTIHAAPAERSEGTSLAGEEEHILRCLGAALIMQWGALPRTLQRELFDTAGSLGPLLETQELRSQIARFLHKQKHEAAVAAA